MSGELDFSKIIFSSLLLSIGKGVSSWPSGSGFASLWSLSKLDQYFQTLFARDNRLKATVAKLGKIVTTKENFSIWETLLGCNRVSLIYRSAPVLVTAVEELIMSGFLIPYPLLSGQTKRLVVVWWPRPATRPQLMNYYPPTRTHNKGCFHNVWAENPSFVHFLFFFR